MKEQQQLLPFKIRDLRRKTQYKIDDDYIDKYARILNVYVTAVYNSLSRHAEFYSQKSFPSEKFISEEHKITERTVRSSIKLLKIANIIDVEKERGRQGKWLNNVYILKDKSEWLKPFELIEKITKLHDQRHQKAYGKTRGTTSQNQRHIKFKPEAPQGLLRIQVKDDTHIKDNKREVKKLTPSQEMKLFIGESKEYFNKVLNAISDKTEIPKIIVEIELNKFISYWTEKNGSGKKQKWEMKDTFELGRRLTTWFLNTKKFHKGSVQKGKPIYNTLQK